MANKALLALVFAAFAAGGVLAREAPDCGDGCGASRTAWEWADAFAAVGGGLSGYINRSGETLDYRFWSRIGTGPWFFADTELFELSLGIGMGRIARRNRWCFLVLTANPSLLWKVPAGIFGIHPLLGAGIDAVLWVRNECLRSDELASDAVPGGRTFVNFSSVKFKAGFGRDFGFSENRFFRLRLLGYYGRRLGNPHPWGGTLRVGIGSRR